MNDKKIIIPSYVYHVSEEDVVLHLSGYKEDGQSHLRPEDLRLYIPQDKTVRIHFPESRWNGSDKKGTTTTDSSSIITTGTKKNFKFPSETYQ